MKELSQQTPTALVTGGAQRIGAAISRTLHAAGYNVIVHYRRSRGAATELVAALNKIRPDSACALPGDFDAPEQPAQLGAEIAAMKINLALLVNNASSFFPTPFADATAGNWDQLFNSNVKAPFFLTQSLLPLLRDARGSVINIVDIHAERPLPEHSVYCMAKAALQMMTRSLAQELGPEIRVNGIAPGAIIWPGGDSVLDDPAEQARILSRVPLERTGSPEDIAELVLFLARGAGYISGQIIAVDGGRSTST